MKSLRVLAIAAFLTATSTVMAAETKVELKGTHLCCPQCVKAADAIIKKVEGVTGKCDKDAGTITITAKDAESAQKALDALAAGGFHGTTDNKDIKIKDDSGATAGKVKTVTLEGIHDCCGACNRAITGAVGKVAGVTGNTAKVKSESFDVTGEFDVVELVKALNAAGYHVKVKK